MNNSIGRITQYRKKAKNMVDEYVNSILKNKMSIKIKKMKAQMWFAHTIKYFTET